MTTQNRFTITYDIVTEESAEHGDFAYNGYVTRDGNTPRKRNYIPKNPKTWSLRGALAFLQEHSFEGVQCDSCPWNESNPPRWISFVGNLENGESVSFSLHPAKRDGVSGASMCRVARLFGAYGGRK